MKKNKSKKNRKKKSKSTDPQAHLRKKLGRFLVYVLRHNPNEIGVTLGRDGYVEMADILAGLREIDKYKDVDESFIQEVVSAQVDKQRLQIEDTQIRARYGHSQQVIDSINYTPVDPPKVLYHGTPSKNLEAIREEGLQPQSRKYVHLSEVKKLAKMVGSRHSQDIAIIEVKCQEAQKEGVEFYHPEPQIWLVEKLAPQYLDIPFDDKQDTSKKWRK